MQMPKNSAAGRGGRLQDVPPLRSQTALLCVRIPSGPLTRIGSCDSGRAGTSNFSTDTNLWDPGTTYQNSWEMAGIPEIVNYSTFSTALYVV